ncbi:chorismate mutase type II [Brevibacterium sanguinis]|uniref:Chorismate mutase type II n=2 Tax=Brevibacterium TaxID=1696 RepID=A0A366IMF2_9MICO|nr:MULTISPECIES: chorismate mutase [Brevibacterium]RBP67147.1 chorismate mutase type II [Brevibacterium sanguinis]RBP73672.1 chorismate mutase type II [Brevibacterium celere]
MTTDADITLDDVRKNIDELDHRIISLLAERQRCVLAAGSLKKDVQS